MDQCSKIIRKFIVISNVWQKIKIEGGGTLPVKSWNHGDDLTVAISVNKARLADKVSHPRRQWGDVPPAWGCCDPYTLTHCPQVSYNPPSYIILSYFSLRPLINDESIIYHVYAEIMSSWKNKSITCHFFASFLEQQFYM